MLPDFKKDVAWFQTFLPVTDDVFLVHEDGRTPIPLYMDACESGCGDLTTSSAYHAMFPTNVL